MQVGWSWVDCELELNQGDILDDISEREAEMMWVQGLSIDKIKVEQVSMG